MVKYLLYFGLKTSAVDIVGSKSGFRIYRESDHPGTVRGSFVRWFGFEPDHVHSSHRSSYPPADRWLPKRRKYDGRVSWSKSHRQGKFYEEVSFSCAVCFSMECSYLSFPSGKNKTENAAFPSKDILLSVFLIVCPRKSTWSALPWEWHYNCFKVTRVASKPPTTKDKKKEEKMLVPLSVCLHFISKTQAHQRAKNQNKTALIDFCHL